MTAVIAGPVGYWFYSDAGRTSSAVYAQQVAECVPLEANWQMNRASRARTSFPGYSGM